MRTPMAAVLTTRRVPTQLPIRTPTAELERRRTRPGKAPPTATPTAGAPIMPRAEIPPKRTVPMVQTAKRPTHPGKAPPTATPTAAALITPRVGDDDRDERLWRLGYPLPGCGHGGHDFLGPDLRCQRSLLRGDDDRLWVPSTGRGQLLLDRTLQLRGLVRGRSSCRGSCGRCSGGAAVASSNTAAATSIAYAAGVATGAATASASNAAAYNAGVAAGASYSMGEIVAAAPTGCATPVVGGVTYYLCGNTWLQPAYGRTDID